MSHIVRLSISIDSLDVLESACKALGCELVRDESKCRAFSRAAVDGCRHIVKVPGAQYDVAVVEHADQPGRWALAYDPWQQGKGIHAVCGDGLGKLKQRYAAERTKRQMRREGWAVREKVKADGQIQVVCTR